MRELIGKDIGQYKILEEIGRRTISTIYRAYQHSLGNYVAIKYLPSFTSEDPQFSSNLREIIKTVARLDHPNIIATYDFGEQGDSLYLVTQYVQGQTLEQRMGESIGFERTAEIIRQVASALDYAYKRGIVHRALKPSNILLTCDDRPILSDFGLAEAVAGSSRLALMGISLTTPEYVSPEECLKQPIDARSDFYSLGIILYQMLTGRVPFEADNPIAIMNAHIEEKPPSPRKLNPRVSKATEKVILKALAKRHEDRYQNAGDLSRALDRALDLLQPREPSRKMQRVGLLDRLNDSLVLLRDRFGGVWLPLVLLAVISIGLLLVAVLGFLVWQYQMEASEERQLASLYSQGKHYMELDECDKALDQFDQILEIDPTYLTVAGLFALTLLLGVGIYFQYPRPSPSSTPQPVALTSTPVQTVGSGTAYPPTDTPSPQPQVPTSTVSPTIALTPTQVLTSTRPRTSRPGDHPTTALTLTQVLTPTEPLSVLETAVPTHTLISVQISPTVLAEAEVIGDRKVAAMAVAPTDGHIVYAAVQGDGIYRSTDAGVSWDSVLPNPSVEEVAVDPSNADVVYVGAWDGIQKSSDGGQN